MLILNWNDQHDVWQGARLRPEDFWVEHNAIQCSYIEMQLYRNQMKPAAKCYWWQFKQVLRVLGYIILMEVISPKRPNLAGGQSHTDTTSLPFFQDSRGAFRKTPLASQALAKPDSQSPLRSLSAALSARLAWEQLFCPLFWQRSHVQIVSVLALEGQIASHKAP